MKFTKIEQFRAVVKAMSYHGNPTVKFTGTVKLHGTNAGVGKENGELFVQSRNHRVTSGHCGFYDYVQDNKEFLSGIVPENHILYGEWCGQGIQKGVAISSLPKMWVPFALRVMGSEEGEGWCPLPDGLDAITAFPTYEIDIDFTRPDLAQDQIRKWVEEVEAECPVGKAKGVSGVGEGIVFTGEYAGRRYWFKAKGQKHSVTKVKTVAAVDVEKMNSIHEFVEYAVTENRLKQGREEIGGDITKMGDFLRWVCNDIHSEETDTLEASGLTAKDVNKYMMTKAREWFKENY